MLPPLIDGGIKRWWCLSVCRDSEAWEHQNWHRGSPRHTWLGHHFQGQKAKGQGHQATLIGCSSDYIIYIDDTIIITRASRCLSIMNIHGARRAGRCRCKAAARLRHTGAGAYCAASRTACLLLLWPIVYAENVAACTCSLAFPNWRV